MSQLPCATVQIQRFGRVRRNLFGQETFDDTDRLAILSCPHCGTQRVLEFREYQLLLLRRQAVCSACSQLYALSPLLDRKGKEGTAAEQADPPPPPKTLPPDATRDFGSW